MSNEVVADSNPDMLDMLAMRAEATITADGSAKFTSDQAAVRATMRADLVVPYPEAVVRVAGIIP